MFKPSTDIYIYPQPPRNADEVKSGVDRYLYCLQQSLPCELKIVAERYPPAVAEEGAQSAAVDDEPSVRSARSRKSTLRRWIPASCFLLYGYIRETAVLALQLRRGVHGQSMIHVNRVGCELQTIAAKIVGIERVMTTVHNLPGEDSHANHWLRRWIEWLSFACGDRHICVSQATFDAWHERVGLRRGKVEIIYNGMLPPDYSQFDRSAYRSRLLPEVSDAVWIGICARLHPMKGHAVLLRAFASLLRRGEHPPVVLVIAGSGTLNDELQQLAIDLEIESSVHFLGHRTDAVEFAAAIDINVLPSIHSETLGYSLIEAMFAGRPSVVSDVGGMKELVWKSGGGKVVKAHDAEALADALSCYLFNPAQMKMEGRKAQSYALAHLTADKMAAATLEAYVKLV